MTILYRAAFLRLLYKLGSCIVKPQWATRHIPSLKAYFRLGLVLILRYFPLCFLGGPTTEGSCPTKGRLCENWQAKPGDSLPVFSFPGPEPRTQFTLLSGSWRQRISTAHGWLVLCTTQIRSSHSIRLGVFLHWSQAAAPPFPQSPVGGRQGWHRCPNDMKPLTKDMIAFEM